MNTCPQCQQKRAISVMEKAMLMPGLTVSCHKCGGPVTVTWGPLLPIALNALLILALHGVVTGFPLLVALALIATPVWVWYAPLKLAT